jgi:hypothetical protein
MAVATVTKKKTFISLKPRPVHRREVRVKAPLVGQLSAANFALPTRFPGALLQKEKKSLGGC